VNETVPTVVVADAATAETAPTSPPPPRTMGRRLREWLRVLHRDPSAEERAARERRERLLEELNRAVAEAPDDLPLRNIIDRINHPDRD